MDDSATFYATCAETFHQLAKNPTIFLESDDALCTKLRTHLKSTYDFAKDQEIKTIKSNALPQLMVADFDLEQVWQQVELQNNALLTRSLTTVSRLLVSKEHLFFKNLPQIEDKDSEDQHNEEEVHYDEEVDLSDLDSEPEPPPDLAQPSKGRPSQVDDDFFKLQEMEEFLHAEEKKLQDTDSGNDSDSDSVSEGSVELFDDVPEEEAVTARYKDFFVSQEEKRKARKRPLEEFEHLEDLEEGPSSFEQRQQRLQRKIEQMEEEALQEKPWQLQGEVTGENRPINSLLEEVVEFDLTSRPAPIQTEQTTMQLEDIIKQRIKDKVFDSVERRTKPVDTPLEYKKKLVLDQEKSKHSLAQIYENDYLHQQQQLQHQEDASKEEAEPELHREVTKMMNALFSKLDALCNFHFTPRRVAPELKIVSNLPAISMEEVAPVGTSEAALLAPEEVKTKSKGGAVVGMGERTATDKRRERRRKKLKQREHAKQRLRREKMRGGNKHSKAKMEREVERAVKGGNVDKMDEAVGDRSVRSSKAFFTQLEDEVKAQIKGRRQEEGRKKKVGVSAKRLKL